MDHALKDFLVDNHLADKHIDVLREGNCGKVVAECAYFIVTQGDMNKKGSYAKFSRNMCAKYPCLKRRNVYKHEYSFFSRKLSQKIRSIRHKEKKMGKSTCSDAEPAELSIQEAHSGLMEEYAKGGSRNWITVLKLFKHVHDDRRSNLIKLSSDSVSEILEKFPLLAEMKLIREELYLLITRSPNGVKLHNSQMLETLERMFFDRESAERSEVEEVDILLALQKVLTDKRIKTKSAVAAIALNQAHEVDLSNKIKSPPHLVVFRHTNNPHQGWILADGRNIPCSETEGIFGMLRDLMACYYAWDLQYPIDFLILGFVQEVVIGAIMNGFEKKRDMSNLLNVFTSTMFMTNELLPHLPTVTISFSFS